MDKFKNDNRWWGGLAVYKTDEDGMAVEPREIEDFIPFGSWIDVQLRPNEKPVRVKLVGTEPTTVLAALFIADSLNLVVEDPAEPDPNKDSLLHKDRYRRICMFNIMSIERTEEDVEVDVDKDAEELF